MVPKNYNYTVKLIDKTFPTYTAQIALSTKCDVGAFRVQLNLLQSGKQIDRITLPNTVYVLFNPYDQTDDAYFPDQSKMAEYMDNEWGTLWRGSVSNYQATRWYYGQFDNNALVTAAHVLSKMTSGRNDPVQVIRHLSYELAAQEVNTGGMMHGKWSEPYSPGTNPVAWTGSNSVIDNYVKNNFKTVQYSQCWVFAGVYTSIARSLGLVTRQVFTFESAHEKPDRPGFYDGVIIRIRDQNGKLVNQQSGSVWNFHSWNEVYLNRRSDGKPGQWQAADSTPQEPSEGNKYMLGPAPISLVKNYNGNNDKYDVQFVRSETSARIENHEYTYRNADFSSCSFRRKLETNNAGALILSADNLLTSKLDLTLTYKNQVTWKSFRKRDLSNSKLVAEAQFHQVEFGGPIAGHLVVVGEDDVSALAEKLTVRTNVEVIDYTGAVVANLKSFSVSVSKEAINTKRAVSSDRRRWQVIHPVELSKEEYLSQVGNNHIRFVFKVQKAGVEEPAASDIFFFEKQVHLVKPKLHMTLSEASTGRHVCDNRFNDITYSYNQFDATTLAYLTHHTNESISKTSDLVKNLLSDDDYEDSERREKEAEEEEEKRKKLEALAFHRSPISTHKVYRLHVTYQNPLSTPLLDVEIRVNPGKMTSLTSANKLAEVIPSIGAFEKIERTIELTAELTGHHSVVVALFNKEVDVRSFLDLAASE